MMRSVRWFLPSVLVLGVVMTLVAGSAAAAIQHEETFKTDRLKIRNVVGEVRVEAGTGSGFEVTVSVEGSDAREGLVRVEATDDELTIRMPEGQKSFVYPKMGTRSNTNFRGESGRVVIRGSGQGMELWADVTVRMPRGSRLEVEHRVGAILAEGVDGDLDLATGSGNVSIDDTRGKLAVATGSGDVELSRVSGEELQVATGSGDVKALDSDGERLDIATGSGDVELESVRSDSMNVATGSGDIGARQIDSDQCDIGTGSGDVKLGLEGMGRGGFDIGTGSGDITLTMPAGSSVEVHAETDGGEIEVALSGDVEYRYKREDEVELTVGGGGTKVRLGSGNGDIRIRD